MARQLPWSILPLDAWPAADALDWTSATSPASIFDDRRSLDNRPAVQQRVLCAAWGRWLGYLTVEGTDITTGGADHLKRQTILKYVDALSRHLSRVTVRSYLTSFLIVAEHMFQPERLCELNAIVRLLQKRISPVGDNDPELIDSVTLNKAVDRMLIDASLISDTYKRAGHYRDALAIKMLIYTPLRISNLGSLRIGKEINKIGDQFRITIPAQAAKARRPLTYPVSVSLTPLIDTYLDVHRPRLLECRGMHWQANAENAFWISRDGGPQSPRTLSRHIGDLTEVYMGERISPHRFRRVAATSIAVMAPNKTNLIMSVLGQSDLTMAEKHYNRAGTIEAGFKFQAIFNT
jgi:integrase